MTAEPIPSAAPWQPDPIRQRAADYTLEDLLNLPPDAPRVELVDGAIHVTPSPTMGHQNIAGLLFYWLRAHAPADYEASQGVSVALSERDSRIPDVVLCRRASDNIARSLFTAEKVVLAVEIVSPGTRRTDRFHKPVEYAAAGIRFYWRVELDPVHVYAYRLSARPGLSGRPEYEPVADSADLLKVDEPFPIALPIAEITP